MVVIFEFRKQYTSLSKFFKSGDIIIIQTIGHDIFLLKMKIQRNRQKRDPEGAKFGDLAITGLRDQNIRRGKIQIYGVKIFKFS